MVFVQIREQPNQCPHEPSFARNRPVAGRAARGYRLGPTIRPDDKTTHGKFYHARSGVATGEK